MGKYPRPKVRFNYLYYKNEPKETRLKLKEDFPNLFCDVEEDDDLSYHSDNSWDADDHYRLKHARDVDEVRRMQFVEKELYLKKHEDPDAIRARVKQRKKDKSKSYWDSVKNSK